MTLCEAITLDEDEELLELGHGDREPQAGRENLLRLQHLLGVLLWLWPFPGEHPRAPNRGLGVVAGGHDGGTR